MNIVTSLCLCDSAVTRFLSSDESIRRISKKTREAVPLTVFFSTKNKVQNILTEVIAQNTFTVGLT
jgi:thiol:disulfide interchange protein